MADACVRCGGPNPPTASVCQWCRNPLPIQPQPLAAPGEYQPIYLAPTPRSSGGGPAFTVVSIPFFILGVLLLVAAAVISAGVHSFNQACSANPLCTPQADPSGGVAAGGAVLLVIGIIFLAYGLMKGRDDRV